MVSYFTKNDILNCCQPTPWDLTNEILYDMCNKHKTHTKVNSIVAKTLIIGRSYAAAIERRKNRGNDDNNDTFYTNNVVAAFKNSELDLRLSLLKDDELLIDNLPQVIDTHGYLVKILKCLTGDNKRSFASKYLHFHLPKLYFIYDSRAANSISAYVPRQTQELKRMIRNELNGNLFLYDMEYLNYYLKCIWLQNDINLKYNILLTPRQIDNLLIAKANAMPKIA